MPTQEFSGGVDHHIGTEFEWTDQVRRAERAIHDQDDAMLMRNFSDFFDINQIKGFDRFDEDGFLSFPVMVASKLAVSSGSMKVVLMPKFGKVALKRL